MRSDVAASIQKKAPVSPESRKLLKTIEDLGVTMTAMHPGSTDPLLANYFLVKTPNQETAEKIVTKIRTAALVEAAYIKPPDRPP